MKYITKKQIKLPKRKRTSKKGDNGRVLIIGGSKDYVGCLALAGLAALRTGVDWVTIAAPEKVAWAINCLSPDLVTKKVKGEYFTLRHYTDIIKLTQKFDAVLIGNGIGTKKSTALFVNKITKHLSKPVVIDADALKLIRIQNTHHAIFTPHKKEYEVLMKNSAVSNVKKVLFDSVIILKGSIDKIITRDHTYYNKTGNEGMTKAGTGDVLAGLCVGFLAQTKNILQSAINATYINGLVGDILLKKKKGYSYIASDLVEEIKRLI